MRAHDVVRAREKKEIGNIVLSGDHVERPRPPLRQLRPFRMGNQPVAGNGTHLRFAADIVGREKDTAAFGERLAGGGEEQFVRRIPGEDPVVGTPHVNPYGLRQVMLRGKRGDPVADFRGGRGQFMPKVREPDASLVCAPEDVAGMEFDVLVTKIDAVVRLEMRWLMVQADIGSARNCADGFHVRRSGEKRREVAPRPNDDAAGADAPTKAARRSDRAESIAQPAGWDEGELPQPGWGGRREARPEAAVGVG